MPSYPSLIITRKPTIFSFPSLSQTPYKFSQTKPPLPPSTKLSLLPPYKPLNDLPKNILAPSLNHIPMTGHNPIKVPPDNPLRTISKRHPILHSDIPQKPLLPQRSPLRILKTRKKLGIDAFSRRKARARILLMRGQIEKNIGKDQGPARFMAKDQFLIRVAFDILILELCIEFVIVDS